MADSPAFRNNGFPDVNVEELTSLDEPDFDQMRDDRSQRTRQAMRVRCPDKATALAGNTDINMEMKDIFKDIPTANLFGFLGFLKETDLFYKI